MCLTSYSFCCLSKNLAALAFDRNKLLVTYLVSGEKGTHDPTSPENITGPAGISEVCFASPSSEDTPLSWCGWKAAPVTPSVHPWEHLSDRIDHRKPADPGNWMVPQKQGKTENLHPEWSGGYQEFFRSIWSLNSFQPDKWTDSRAPCFFRPRSLTERRKTVQLINDIRVASALQQDSATEPGSLP